jgi:hypothetical protein
MNRIKRATMMLTMLSCFGTLSLTSALAAGPQPLPAQACNAGTLNAGEHAPNRTSSEAIPHIEHAFPIPVPYCHHFNPTAPPPPAP